MILYSCKLHWTPKNYTTVCSADLLVLLAPPLPYWLCLQRKCTSLVEFDSRWEAIGFWCFKICRALLDHAKYRILPKFELFTSLCTGWLLQQSHLRHVLPADFVGREMLQTNFIPRVRKTKAFGSKFGARKRWSNNPKPNRHCNAFSTR